MDRPAKGETVSIPVGQGDGETDLVGVPAQQIRVCDASGVEMLFALVAPSGSSSPRGRSRPAAPLVIPAECANATATYYAYFDNPSAREVPDHPRLLATCATVAWRRGRATPARLAARRGRCVAPGLLGDGESPLRQALPEDGGGRWRRASWIATRQSGLSIIGGAKYDAGQVKAQDVQGYAGWYSRRQRREPDADQPDALRGRWHLRLEGSDHRSSPPRRPTAPIWCDPEGTGTAWFDDVSLECATVSRLSARAGKPETIPCARRAARPRGATTTRTTPAPGITACRCAWSTFPTSSRATPGLH